MPAPAARQGTVPGLIARNNQEKYQPKKRRDVVDASTTKSTTKIKYEDGSTRIVDKSEGGRVSPKKATHGASSITSDKRKKPLSPVIDKRTVKQKLKDAQARSN